MNASSTAQDSLEINQTIIDSFIEYADKVWQYAEVGFQEHKSAALLLDWVESQNFTITHHEVSGLDTAWIATYGSGSPVIGILVEYDALPGLGNEAVATKTA